MKESEPEEIVYVSDQLRRFGEEVYEWALDNTRIKNLPVVTTVSELIVASCLASVLRIPLEGFRVVPLEDLYKEIEKADIISDPASRNAYGVAVSRAYSKAFEIYGIVALRRDENNPLTRRSFN